MISKLFELQASKHFEVDSEDDLYISFLGSFASDEIQAILFHAIEDSVANSIFALSDHSNIWVKRSFAFDDIVTEIITTGNSSEEHESDNPEFYGLDIESEFYKKLKRSGDGVLNSIIAEGDQIINNVSPALIAGAILSSYENEEIPLSSSMKEFIAVHLYGTTVLRMNDYLIENPE